MAMTDRFDLPVTAASAAAVADYVAALDLLLSANTGADALLERAIAADPDFALAHIAQARLLQLQARMGEARAAAARARALAERVSAREQRHIEAVALAIAGAASEALAQIRAHAAEYPRDALPLSLALGVFGLLGFSGRRDHHRGATGAARRIGAALARRLVVSRISRLGPDRDRRGRRRYAAGRALAGAQPAQRPWGASAGARLFRSGRCGGRRRFRRALARRLRARRASALPSVVAPGAVRTGSRQQRARQGDLCRQHQAVGGAIGADAEPRRIRHRFCGAGGSIGATPPLDDRMGRGCRACPPAFSARRVSPLPICTPPLPKPRPATTKICKSASPGWSIWCATGACRRER